MISLFITVVIDGVRFVGWVGKAGSYNRWIWARARIGGCIEDDCW